MGQCSTCDPAEPTSNDPNMTVSCKINVNTNRKFCKFQCAPAYVFGGINNKPDMRFTKIACKCPRGPNGRKCNWFNKRNIANFQNYQCIPKATPAPVGEPGVEPGTGGSSPVCPTGNTMILADGTVTCPDGSTPVGGTPVTTPAATTMGATSAVVTTVGPTTGSSGNGTGGGSVPVCPTGNTLILADGTVTCPDGSTPVGGTPVTTPAATTVGATSAAVTTVEPTTGSSGTGTGGGSVPVCPTGNTLILADGTVTCPEGSTPVGGNPATTQAAAPSTTPAAATTLAGGSGSGSGAGTGGGSVPVCPTGNTLILADGTVTCPDGSTPVGGTPVVTTPAATNAPATNAPATNGPATSASATNAPATNAPATSAPATGAPATSASATNAPATSAAATTAPATTAPATPAPATTAPATTAPATTAPATAAPATTAPATTAPATTAPPTTQNPCLDSTTKYGLKEDPAGRGGCPPKLVNYGLGMV